jgi:hypothetical protein
MNGYNKLILIGNLTRNPELKTLPGSDTQVCNFSLAINRRWRDSQADLPSIPDEPSVPQQPHQPDYKDNKPTHPDISPPEKPKKKWGLFG